ncbi:MAG: bacteriocin [Eubacteriales bacterium]|nr:bacteriocin [Eubacteriales bacterium]
MKTKEELNSLKEEAETVSREMHELTDEELAQVTGGGLSDIIELALEQPGVEIPGIHP